ncbi:acyl-coenzyme A diphosphatase NUDT19-like [Battus philenor]|uniref:acyl-coenzyme A diphosphatase NUDT19-like n=1 Tax=Battus philenor TaxID=42288 RepID=UPI0035D02A2F
MKRAIGKCWRDSASLIVATKRHPNIVPVKANADNYNYDILLQTRTHTASFANSVVFPGGVCEAADGDEGWFKHLNTFGFTQCDFDSLHQFGSPSTLLFENNPVQRHVALRITAIRETFEELGLLFCSRDHKSERGNEWASLLSIDDLKYWRQRISKNPADLLVLCKEYKCYPDIWSLYYWSTWLTPSNQPRRFATAFFVTALESKPLNVYSNSEVVNVKWLSPQQVLNSSKKLEVVLYPPQTYEFIRLGYLHDINQLVSFAKERSRHSNISLYPVYLYAKDGIIALLPGDHLYPSELDVNDKEFPKEDKTVLELRGNNQPLHRIEKTKTRVEIVIQNYETENHVNMNNIVTAFPGLVH